MSLYLSDGDLYAGWHSTGRWFALAGAVAGLAGIAGYLVTHGCGCVPANLPASDQMVAFMAQWVGGGFAALMAFVAWSSISISRKERGDVEVLDTGVRRILDPGSENFLPREEIAGMVVRMGGGVTLVDHAGQQRMIVPRSLDGYRECIAEIKALGVERLPANWIARRERRKPKVFEFIYNFIFGVIFLATFERETVQTHHVAGIMLVALLAGRAAFDARSKRAFVRGDWLTVLVALGWVAYRWIWVW